MSLHCIVGTHRVAGCNYISLLVVAISVLCAGDLQKAVSPIQVLLVVAISGLCAGDLQKAVSHVQVLLFVAISGLCAGDV